LKTTSWKDIAELVGIGAIVLSLIFVGMETRNGAIQAELNTRALELTAYQQLVENIAEMNTLSIENPSLSDAVRKAREAPMELSIREQQLVTSWLFLRFRHGDMAYFQYERGAIDEMRLQSALKPLTDAFGNQFVRDFWERMQENFVPSYRAYVNRHMAVIDEPESK
jgi:hypothetical protein